MDVLWQLLIEHLPGILVTIALVALSRWQSDRKIEITRRETNSKADNIRLETSARVEENRAAQEKNNREQVAALMTLFTEVSNRASAAEALIKSQGLIILAANEREGKRDRELGELRASVAQRVREHDATLVIIDKMKAEKGKDAESISALTLQVAALTELNRVINEKQEKTLAALEVANAQLKLFNEQVTELRNQLAIHGVGGTATPATIAANEVNIAADTRAAAPVESEVKEEVT